MLSRAYGQAVITENAKDLKTYGLSTQQQVVDAGIEHALKAFELLPTYDSSARLLVAYLPPSSTAARGIAPRSWRTSMPGRAAWLSSTASLQ